jgi:hypothetical protein
LNAVVVRVVISFEDGRKEFAITAMNMKLPIWRMESAMPTLNSIVRTWYEREVPSVACLDLMVDGRRGSSSDVGDLFLAAPPPDLLLRVIAILTVVGVCIVEKRGKCWRVAQTDSGRSGVTYHYVTDKP